MTKVVLAAAALAAASLVPAQAMRAPVQSSEWCAVYRSGSENCGFATQAQCQGTVSGTGGFCRMSGWPSQGRRAG
jgi:hypothetical protein